MVDEMVYAQSHSNTSTKQLGDAFGPSLEIVEELVDVIVMCEQLRLMCGLTSEQVNELAAEKLKRAIRKTKGM